MRFLGLSQIRDFEPPSKKVSHEGLFKKYKPINPIDFSKKEKFIYDKKPFNFMTLIIGMKYKDGVAIIGDTKVIDDPNKFASHHQKKIFEVLTDFKPLIPEDLSSLNF